MIIDLELEIKFHFSYATIADLAPALSKFPDVCHCSATPPSLSRNNLDDSSSSSNFCSAVLV